MKRLARAYFDEAKWFYQNYIPTMEEYMHVALKALVYLCSQLSLSLAWVTLLQKRHLIGPLATLRLLQLHP